MFEPGSRYFNLETATVTAVDGRVLRYVKRRFLPQGDDMPLLVEVTITDGDRPDLITARSLGDPQQFWRVADANNAMNPFDLTIEPGSLIRVPVPQVES